MTKPNNILFKNAQNALGFCFRETGNEKKIVLGHFSSRDSMNVIIFNSVLKDCNLITKVNNDLRNFQNREKRYGKTNQLVLNMMLKKCVHLKAEIETSNHH